jgi:hypothetical protein
MQFLSENTFFFVFVQKNVSKICFTQIFGLFLSEYFKYFFLTPNLFNYEQSRFN